jgi:ADP-ribosylation factor-binding protein GGA
MKLMAGAVRAAVLPRALSSLLVGKCQNPDAKPDYRTQSLAELNKLEQKVILLNEMLDNVDTSRRERFAAGDVYDVRTFMCSSTPLK